MITPEQEKWISHLDDSDSVKIYPADPKAGEKFKKIKRQIQSVLGDKIIIEHRGATSLGISGQGELDIYIPTSLENFDFLVSEVKKIFGEPKSLYALDRARFLTYVDGTKAEVFVINKKVKSWTDGLRFEKSLKENPEALEAYRKLKEENQGLSTQKYYRKKIEFINNILEKSTF